MPIVVNREQVPDELIQEEVTRLKANPEWETIPDILDRSYRLKRAAEDIAVNRILLEQAAWADDIVIDEKAVAAEVEQVAVANGCRSAFDRSRLLGEVEGKHRIEALLRALVPGFRVPTKKDAKAFFKANRKHFLGAEMVEASHIVKHVDAGCADEDARAAMEAAFAELKAGAPFAEVAARHSDCKENGGDLGRFSRGVMVEEFDNVVFALRGCEPSAVFRTPFGYHIAQVRKRIAPAPPAFEEVERHITKTLTFGLRQSAYEAAIAVLRHRASIERVSQAQAERLCEREGAA